MRATLRDTVTNVAERHLDLTWENAVAYDLLALTRWAGRSFHTRTGPPRR
jgi:hypothetical protein